MRRLTHSLALAVPSLPPPTEELRGSLVRLTTDNKPYWCDGKAWIDLTLTGTPAGNSREVQYNNGGAWGGAANVEIDNGDLMLAAGAPVTPPANYVKLWGKRFGPTGSRVMLAAVGSSGMDYTLQPSIWRQKIAHWNPSGNSIAAPGVYGFSALTSVGKVTARKVGVANTLARAKRLGYVSAAVAGSLAGHYSKAAQYTLGTGSNTGGFFYSCRFGISDATLQTVGRTFVGLSSSVVVPTNVEPSTLTNCIGVGNIASGTTLQIFFGGSVAQPPINLGDKFPVALGELYDLTLWSPPNQNGVVHYMVERIGTNHVATGVLGPGTPSVTLPSNTTLLAHRAWRSNNTAAASVGIDISSVYIETDW